MDEEKKKLYTSIWILKASRALLRKLAEKDRRSMVAELATLIEAAAQERGISLDVEGGDDGR